jgi:hypothetical protein
MLLHFYIIAFTGKEERRSPSTGAALRVGGWMRIQREVRGRGILTREREALVSRVRVCVRLCSETRHMENRDMSVGDESYRVLFLCGDYLIGFPAALDT